ALLRLVENLFDGTLADLVRLSDDLRRRLDQTTQQCALTDDTRVVLDVRSGRNRIQQLGDVRHSADALELLRLAQILRERDRVDDLTALEQTSHRAEDATVRLAIEHRVIDDL